VGLQRQGALAEGVLAAELWPMRRVRAHASGDYAAGYVTGKWASEVLLDQLSRRCDVPVATVRCSMILPHRELPQVVNRHDAFARLIYGIVKTGIAPASFFAEGYTASRHYDGLPVDLVAAVIARIVATSGEAFETYHLCRPSSVGGASLDDLIRWVATAGFGIEWLQHGAWYPEFVRRLALLSAQERKYSPEAIAHRWRRPVENAKGVIDLDTANFRGTLAAAGLAAVPSLDEAYVHHCLPAICGASA
jgi:fatty acid CoA ligase FadD9